MESRRQPEPRTKSTMTGQQFGAYTKILVRTVSLLGLAGYLILFVMVFFLAKTIGDGAPPLATHSWREVSWRDVVSVGALFAPLIYFAVCFATSFAKQKSQATWWGVAAHIILAFFNFAVWWTMRSNQPAHWHAVVVIFVASLCCAVLWCCMYMALITTQPTKSK